MKTLLLAAALTLSSAAIANTQTFGDLLTPSTEDSPYIFHYAMA